MLCCERTLQSPVGGVNQIGSQKQVPNFNNTPPPSPVYYSINQVHLCRHLARTPLLKEIFNLNRFIFLVK